MHGTVPPPLPEHWLRFGKRALGYFAVAIASIGGIATAMIAALDVGKALLDAFDFQTHNDLTISYAVKAIDALLLSLVQFLLGAYLWRILDPRSSLIDDETVTGLEEVKQMLCKVILVILAVRLLDLVLVAHDKLRWEHMVIPAGLAALAMATSAMAKTKNGAS